MSTKQYVDIDRTLQRIENSAIHPDNVQAIRDFVDYCAAQGISEVQQERLAQSWKTMLEKFAPDQFRMWGATEEELRQMLAGVNRSDYAESTPSFFEHGPVFPSLNVHSRSTISPTVALALGASMRPPRSSHW